MQEHFYESGSCVQKNCASLGVHPILFRPTGVQNSPNCIAKLCRNSLSVLANHVRVDRLRNRRAVGVPESLLTQFLRCPETAHQSCVRMTERVEAIPAWHLDTERPKQWPELSSE